MNISSIKIPTLILVNPWKILSSNIKINEISITRLKLYDSNQLNKWLNQKVQQKKMEFSNSKFQPLKPIKDWIFST